LPHQCIGCGKVYPNGSKEILAGCSVCGGRKFYYIAQPLDQEEIDDVKQNMDNQMGNALERVIKDIPREKYNELGEEDTDGEWVKIRPEDYDGRDRRRAERVQSLQDRNSGLMGRIAIGRELPARPDTNAPGNVSTEEKKAKDTKKHKVRKLRVGTGRKVAIKKEKPAVITVVEKGVYEINLKSLLENSPIIIQKDGSYLIHLPSLFQNMDEE